MSTEQLTNYLFIALIAVIAVGTGVSAGCAIYIKKMELAHKPVPKQVVDVKAKADWLVSEASTMLDLTGAQKKSWATNQLQETNPHLSDAEARGAIQSAYDQKQVTQSESDSGSAVSLGTVEDDGDEAKED